MDRASFAAALGRASERCREFASGIVTDRLPAALRFDLCAERVSGPTADDCDANGWRVLPPLVFQRGTAEQVAEALWADGWVPGWVNLSVHAADDQFTYIEVSLSRQLVDPAIFRPPLWGPDAPFEVRGPSLPPGWVSVAESGRFRLGWAEVLEGRTPEPRPPDSRPDSEEGP